MSIEINYKKRTFAGCRGTVFQTLKLRGERLAAAVFLFFIEKGYNFFTILC